MILFPLILISLFLFLLISLFFFCQDHKTKHTLFACWLFHFFFSHNYSAFSLVLIVISKSLPFGADAVKDICDAAQPIKVKLNTNTIIKDLEKENIEMVAMLSRKRNVLQRIVEGSKSQQMAKQTSVPLLVLKGDVFAPTRWETVVDEEEVPLWERD